MSKTYLQEVNSIGFSYKSDIINACTKRKLKSDSQTLLSCIFVFFFVLLTSTDKAFLKSFSHHFQSHLVLFVLTVDRSLIQSNTCLSLASYKANF